ncbi:hypothetical protein HMN09_00030500 [Mycena chlorophos]|uniref:Uncharacterized protein n=1 Tax=Mycena chlorophos TaxID=658473 RepID=A0A8H6TNX1_MYCCL|nr:hypothetical protein HMN09_00030500 [Mycena chlorophos]
MPSPSIISPRPSLPPLSDAIPPLHPRRSQAHIVVPDPPLTPPMSPGNSESGDDTIVIDDQPRYSGPDTHGAFAAVAQPREMEVEQEDAVPAPVAPQPRRPLRLLEDEHVHLQRSGLRLTDFEAPIVPHTSSIDDTRHFLHLPLPPTEEMPGLLREEELPPVHERFDPIAYHFLEF